MQVYVCVKHVPDTAANIKAEGETGFSESVKFVLNPYDEYAVEEAVRMVKEKGGEVVAVCIGKAAAMSTLRSALAVGVDRGILVKIDQQLPEPGTIARALQQAIAQDGKPDLIFAGRQSVDSEGMQTHYRLAAGLGMPVVSDVVAFELQDGRARVERESGGGAREVIDVALPCVIGANKGLNEPRYPKLPDVLKAKKKPVKEIDIGELSLEDREDACRMVKLEVMPDRGQATMLTGGVREMVDELVRILDEEEKVL
jgi:electron transfer flavoprotein beta subunit